MVDTRGENDQIVLHQLDAHPLVLLATDVKVSLTVPDVADFLVLVEMLVEEHLHLLLVHIAHGLGGHGDLIAVLVSALGGQGIDVLDFRAVLVENTQGGEVGFIDGTTVVVGFALVALIIMKCQSVP